MYIVYAKQLHMICQYICQFSWRQIPLDYWNNDGGVLNSVFNKKNCVYS